MPQFDYGNVNPFAAVQQGVDFSQGMIDKQAQRQAGNLLAQTASPAAAPLFQTGQLDQGAKVQQYGQDQQKQAIADHLTFLTKAASALSQIPDDGTQTARRQALTQHILPALQQMGATPQDLQKLQTTDLSDQSLSVFQQAAKLQIEKLGNDLVGVNPANGAARVLYKGEDAAPKHDWKEVTNPDGSTSFIDLNAASASGVGVAGAPPPAAPAASPSGIGPGLDKLTGAGVAITSAFRTPQHNADVGGVANSQHLTGQAVDLVPPKGMNMVQLAALAQQSMPGAKIINEGDHVHVQWAGAASAGNGAGATPGGPPRIAGSAPGTKELKGAQGEEQALSNDAVQLLAGRYLKDGTLPPMGMGKAAAANRTAILNAATKMAGTLGLDAGDLVAGTIGTKAAASALNKATTIRSQVEGSEATVNKNADFALSLAPKGAGPTGIPVLNRWIQAGRKKVAGDPDVAAFDSAIGTVADEYAKVMTTNTGTGGTTSDSARQEAYRRLNGAMTIPQLHSVISAMETEMSNRASSLRDVEAGLRQQIRGGGSPSPPAPGGQPAPTNRPPLSAIFGR